MPAPRPAPRPHPLPDLARRRAGAAIAAALAGPASPGRARSDAAVLRTRHAALRVTELARGLQRPWSVVVLPDGRLLVSERPGRLRLVEHDGRLSVPLAGTPSVFARHEGGLLGLALSPGFARDRTLFLAYAEPAPAGARLAVARAEFDGTALRGTTTVFRQQPDAPGGRHLGGRLAFDREGMLFVTLGDRTPVEDRGPGRGRARDPSSHLGKIVRIRPEGGAAPGNPFAGRAGARPEGWSVGHRNVQGAAVHPDTGRLWATEHGPIGGDELNLVRAGGDHGWPVASRGHDGATGRPIGDGGDRDGLAAPLRSWPDTIAPSGLAFYRSDAIPGWSGGLLAGALAGRCLLRLELDGESVVGEERIPEPRGRRVRDVTAMPDGAVLVLLDEDDAPLLRLAPA